MDPINWVFLAEKEVGVILSERIIDKVGKNKDWNLVAPGGGKYASEFEELLEQIKPYSFYERALYIFQYGVMIGRGLKGG